MGISLTCWVLLEAIILYYWMLEIKVPEHHRPCFRPYFFVQQNALTKINEASHNTKGVVNDRINLFGMWASAPGWAQRSAVDKTRICVEIRSTFVTRGTPGCTSEVVDNLDPWYYFGPHFLEMLFVGQRPIQASVRNHMSTWEWMVWETQHENCT